MPRLSFFFFLVVSLALFCFCRPPSALALCRCWPSAVRAALPLRLWERSDALAPSVYRAAAASLLFDGGRCGWRDELPYRALYLGVTCLWMKWPGARAGASPRGARPSRRLPSFISFPCRGLQSTDLHTPAPTSHDGAATALRCLCFAICHVLRTSYELASAGECVLHYCVTAARDSAPCRFLLPRFPAGFVCLSASLPACLMAGSLCPVRERAIGMSTSCFHGLISSLYRSCSGASSCVLPTSTLSWPGMTKSHWIGRRSPCLNRRD